MRGWKIYYSNGTFDSSQGVWDEAPSQDVQAVILYLDTKDKLNRPNKNMMIGKKYYCYDQLQNRYFATDKEGEMAGSIKHGTTINGGVFNAIKRSTDRDFGADTLNIRTSTADFDLGKDG